MGRYRQLAREQAEAAEVVGLYQRFAQREADLATAREMLDDPEMAEMARDEVATAQAELATLDTQLQTALLPRDPDDARNAFLEIRAGTGARNRPCSRPTWPACTCALPNARAGAAR
jgi:peptide chain release factor 1